MPRSWLALLVPAPFRLAPTVSDTVAHLRSADPESQWSFERVGDGLVLWLHATDEALAATARNVPWAAEAISHPPAAAHVAAQDIGLVTALSQLSSDFAMSLLRRGELPGESRRDVAVSHLTALARLLPAAQRSSFLFHCWQHWSRNLTPFERVSLFTAATEAGSPSVVTIDWSHYRDAIVRMLGDRLKGAAYLLLDHAHRTHNRLGIDHRTEALAALVVRQSTTLSERELQQV